MPPLTDLRLEETKNNLTMVTNAFSQLYSDVGQKWQQ
jgi:hypothetical protein